MYKSLDDAKDDYRIDFANAYLGGAESLSYGSVQEEIMFSICPEMNVGRLFSPRMKEHQAICITGTEQFTLPIGYGHRLEFGGLYKDQSMVINDKRQSFVVAIDALDFRGLPTSMQYTQDGILRIGTSPMQPCRSHKHHPPCLRAIGGVVFSVEMLN